MQRKVFINLPVRNLDDSLRFFKALGFSSDPQWCDDTAVNVTISDTIVLMLLTHEKFQTFIPNRICDTATQTEALLCLSCESRDEVDTLVQKAVAAGGSTFREAEDHGFMYGHGFRDVDGHVWELIYLAQNAA